MKLKGFIGFKIGVFLLALAISITSCKTKKQKAQEIPVTPGPAKANAEAGAMAKISNNVLQAKNQTGGLHYQSEVDYIDGGKEISLNMEVHAKKGEYVWLSAKALGLVNVARVLFKPDSIRILDLMNKKYIVSSYSYLNRYTAAPLTYKEVENLIWGNALFDPSAENSSIDSLVAGLGIKTKLGKVTQTARFSAQFKAEKARITEEGNKAALEIVYRNFEQFGQNSFPKSIVINIEGEKKVECRFALSNFATDERPQPSFNVPKSFKVENHR